MNKLLKYTFVTVLLLVAVISANAQPPAGGGPPGGPSGGAPPPCWPPPCIPVDGGISFLIAIGAAFGGKKAFDHFKTKEDSDV
jgi:hypothetical protein